MTQDKLSDYQIGYRRGFELAKEHILLLLLREAVLERGSTLYYEIRDLKLEI